MSSKEISQVFMTYQKCRITFVQTVAELVKHPRNIEGLNVHVYMLTLSHDAKGDWCDGVIETVVVGY